MKQKPILDKWKLFKLLGYDNEHKEVRRFHNSNAKIKVVCAPRRGSKSYAAAHDVLTDILIPETRGWIVGPTYDLAEKEFRYIHQRLVLERKKTGLPGPKTCFSNARTGQLLIRFPWGSIVEGKSSARPESLLGEAVDWIIYSEAAQLPRQIRERYTEPTLQTTQGRELVPTTPQMTAEWVYELFTYGQEGNFSEIDSFHWGVDANPAYPMEEFERAKKFHGADSPVFREQYLGEWVFYGGLVYPQFNPQMHVIEPFEIPKHWKMIRSIDFGHRDPFVCLFGFVGPENEIYITQEYYNTEGVSLREHAVQIKGYTKDYKVGDTVADPEGRQQIEDLTYEQIYCNNAINDRGAGRMRVTEYLTPTPDGPQPFPDREKPRLKEKYPRLYIFNTCKELLRELRFFRWKEGKNIEGERERTEGDDHAMDALRYLVMTRPSPFKLRTRFPAKSIFGIMHRMKLGKMAEKFIH